MVLQLLRVKFQQLIVSESSVAYPGSIGLPEELIKASGLKIFEQVHVNNLTNGHRIITYVVRSNNSGHVTLNGAASKLFHRGDKIHVLAYGYFNNHNADVHTPKIIYTDANNKILQMKSYVV